MVFRKITLKSINGQTLEFKPEKIQNIVFEKDTITLFFCDEHFTTVLKKEAYYYPHWEYFIRQLTRIFEIEM